MKPPRIDHRIFVRFGKKAQFLHWQTIEHATFAKTAVVDLNAGWIFKDSSVSQHLLRQGAGLLRKPRNDSRKVERVPLSKFHGIEISETPLLSRFQTSNESEDILAFYSALQRMSTEPRTHIPWPKWFQSGFRASQHIGERK